MHAFATAQHQPHLVCIAVMTLCAIATNSALTWRAKPTFIHNY